MPRKRDLGTKVTKSVSMPLELLVAVQDEAIIMGRSLSDAFTILLRLGLQARRISEENLEEELQKSKEIEYLEKLRKAKSGA